MTELIPPVADLADLVLAMVDPPWPTTEDDRLDFYRRVGLTQLEWDNSGFDERPDDHSVWHRFATSLPEVDGMDTMFRDQFLGLSLFAYNQPGDDGPASRTAYPLLKDRFTARFGAPTEEWGTEREPACYWAVGAVQVEMYCFQRLASGVMLRPSHRDRTAEHDRQAAADPRNVRPPRNNGPVEDGS